MQNLSIHILVYISSGLSIFVITWALLIKLRNKNFAVDLPKIFVTNSIKSFKSSCITILLLLSFFTVTAIYNLSDINDFFANENLLLMVPIVLSFIVIYIMEPLSRK